MRSRLLFLAALFPPLVSAFSLSLNFLEAVRLWKLDGKRGAARRRQSRFADLRGLSGLTMWGRGGVGPT